MNNFRVRKHYLLKKKALQSLIEGSWSQTTANKKKSFFPQRGEDVYTVEIECIRRISSIFRLTAFSDENKTKFQKKIFFWKCMCVCFWWKQYVSSVKICFIYSCLHFLLPDAVFISTNNTQYCNCFKHFF